MTRYFVRFDDIHASSDFALLKHTLKYVPTGVPVVLGIVPENHDPDLGPRAAWHSRDVTWLQDLPFQRAVLFAQHGTHHVLHQSDGTLLSHARYSEFAGLEFEAQLQLLEKGQRLLHELGLRLSGFMPPAHGFDQATIRACKAVGLTTIFDGVQRRPFLYDDVEFIPCLTEKTYPIPWFSEISTCYHIEKVPLGQKELSRLGNLPAFEYSRSTKKLNSIESKIISLGLKTFRRFKRKPNAEN